MLFTIAVIKFTVTALLIIPGWYEDFSPVYPPTDYAKVKKEENQIGCDDEWFVIYRMHVAYALLAGAL